MPPRAVEVLGVDLLSALNKTGAKDAPALRNLLEQALPVDSEQAIRELMRSPEYQNSSNSEYSETFGRVQRGFAGLYPDSVFRSEDGGVITDGNIDTYQDNLPAQLGEGSFVLSRSAVKLLGAELLGRLNAAARSGEGMRISKLRHKLGQARKRSFKPQLSDAYALMRTPVYGNRQHPNNHSTVDQVAEMFRQM